MKKLGLLALGAAAFLASTGFLKAEYLYHTVWYTDGTYTTFLNEVYDVCVNGTWVRTPEAVGPTSQYYIQTPFGTCPGGAW